MGAGSGASGALADGDDSGSQPGADVSRYASGHRQDDSQRAIVAVLERLGFACLNLCGVGGGAPDLLAARQDGRMWLIEVKSPGKPSRQRLRDSQVAFAAKWPVPVIVLKSSDEALAWGLSVGRKTCQSGQCSSGDAVLAASSLSVVSQTGHSG
jgi:hypothetical protein